MNREQRRHPEKDRDTKAPPEQELRSPAKPPKEGSVRGKSNRHKKSTADKWNQ